jgi:hypothetical protein
MWRASWGSGEAAQTTTAYKVNGSRGLMLTCNSSSFGVYQEVTVTPGKAYQMDGWWKGNYTAGTDAWYDSELIDGPFNYTTADIRPDDLPTKVCTYDLAKANWNWERMSSAYYTAPICKNGIRVATGTKMTVVLKTGGFSQPYGYYDDISLVEVPSMTVANAKKQPNGTAVMLEGNIVTAVFASGFYIEPTTRDSAIKVQTTTSRPALGQTMFPRGLAQPLGFHLGPGQNCLRHFVGRSAGRLEGHASRLAGRPFLGAMTVAPARRRHDYGRGQSGPAHDPARQRHRCRPRGR